MSAGNTTVQFAEDLALELKNEAKKHGIAAAIDGGAAAVEGQPLVIQYEVRLENTHSCGGLYIKLLSGESLDLTKFDGASPYSIMFGPDHCGGTNKVHFILRHKNPKTGEFEEKHAKNPPSAVTSDKKTHLYKLVINADNTYEFFIDQESKGKGNLLDDMQPAINPPKLVDDPSDSKPEDWVDEAKINDPAASKPDDWDEDAPKMILDEEAVIPSEWHEDEPDEVADPDATMPEDWDEEEDGDWEAPMVKNPLCEAAGCGKWERPKIKNPDYKGKWEHPQIDNPDYIGEWKAKQIDNPNFFEDKTPYMFSTFSAVGIELWSMSNGIFFDNFLITRNVEDAAAFAASTWGAKSVFETSKASSGGVGGGVMESVNKLLDSAADTVEGLGMPKAHAKNSIFVAIAIVIATTIFLCCSGGGDDEFEEFENHSVGASANNTVQEVPPEPTASEDTSIPEPEKPAESKKKKKGKKKV